MQKGFNMFSALVAVVLIMTSVVLVTTMTTTEDKMGNQLYYMLNTFQLNDAAAIARSDALQSFNYNFRASMQDYLTFDSTEMDTESGFSILTTSNHNNWTEIVNTFERVILLTDVTEEHNFDAVIEFVANRTVLQFNEGSYGRYHVSLSSKDATARQNTVDALNEAIKCLGPDEKFLEVVDCDDTSCDLGTFYFNIPLDCVNPETYEALPKIVVKDLITKGETKLPILPRTRLKIYIPLRFFKAVFVARQNAEAMEDVQDGTLRNAQLGFCDDGCSPREEPNSSINGSWNHECPGEASDNEMQNLSGKPAGLVKYNTGGGTVANIGLNAYAKQIICNSAIDHEAWKTQDDDFYNISGPDYATDFPSHGVNGLEPDITGLIKIPECPFKKILASVESNATKIIKSGDGGKLYCGKMRLVEADVGFEERNPLYIVKGENIRYKIRITTDLFDSPSSGTAECVNGTSPNSCGG